LCTIDIINPSARIHSDDIRLRPDKSEVERLLGSNEKIMRLTGWKPETSLMQRIQDTISWFRVEENMRRYKWEIYNV
jgi:nucleoside-diphosphate-sugar epimerase